MKGSTHPRRLWGRGQAIEQLKHKDYPDTALWIYEGGILLEQKNNKNLCWLSGREVDFFLASGGERESSFISFPNPPDPIPTPIIKYY